MYRARPPPWGRPFGRRPAPDTAPPLGGRPSWCKPKHLGRTDVACMHGVRAGGGRAGADYMYMYCTCTCTQYAGYATYPAAKSYRDDAAPCHVAPAVSGDIPQAPLPAHYHRTGSRRGGWLPPSRSHQLYSITPQKECTAHQCSCDSQKRTTVSPKSKQCRHALSTVIEFAIKRHR